MSIITHQEVKVAAETLTGLKTQGIVEKQTQVKGEAYKVYITDGFLVCLREKNGWLITLFKENNLQAVWRNIPTDVSQIGIQIINMFIKENNTSVNPKFEKEFMDIIKDIQRKTYQSDVGPIVLHSRPHQKGTEGVLQVDSKNIILVYIWERPTSKIEKWWYVPELPF